MPLTNAQFLADELLTRWLVENSPIKLSFLLAWIWQEVTAKELQVVRTTELSPAASASDCQLVESQLPTISQVGFSYLEFITRYQICATDLDRFQHPNQLDAVLFALAKRRLLYAYAERLGADSGVGSLRALVAGTNQILDMTGSALTLACLDEAYERVTAGNGHPTLIMSHSRTIRTYRELCRQAGFSPERAPWKWYNPATGRVEDGTVDAFNGTPWLKNDMINRLGSGTERTFFMVAGDDGAPRPTRGLVGIVPAAVGRTLFARRTVNAIPMEEGSDHIPGHDTWVSMPTGVALGSQGALGILENYGTVGACEEIGA
jgi:hypothetical protein